MAKKICLVTFLYGAEGGGAGQVPQVLAEGLANKGFDVSVITTRKIKEIQQENKNGVTIYRYFPSNLYWVKDKDRYSSFLKIIWHLIDVWNPLSYLAITKLLAEIQPDVLHVHKLRGISPAVWAAGKKLGIAPIIHTTHDFELISPEATLLSKIGRMANEKHWILRPYQAVRALFSKSVQVWTAPSKFTIRKHLNFGFFQYTQSLVVPNTHGYSLQELEDIQTQGRTRETKQEKFSFLFLGRQEKEKGLYILCEAFIALNKDLPKTKLIIAGSGTQSKPLAEIYDHPNIHFVGSVEGQVKESYLNQANVVVVPSIWEEIFGIVVVEAFAFGVPVIGSRIGGISELVREGETGYLVEPNNPEALKTTMLKSMHNNIEQEKMATNCFAEGKKYTLDKFIDGYLNSYDRHDN